MIMRRCLALGFVIVTCASVVAQTAFENSHATLGCTGTPDAFECNVEVEQNAIRSDFTCALIFGGGTTLDPISTCLDEGTFWYLVEAGDAFTIDNITSGRFPEVGHLGFPGNGTVIHNDSFDVGYGDFYLGVRTGLDGLDYDVLGWLELRNTTGNTLELIRNAVGYETEGIIVGTTTLVPEPTSLFLLTFALLAMFPRRSCRR